MGGCCGYCKRQINYMQLMDRRHELIKTKTDVLKAQDVAAHNTYVLFTRGQLTKSGFNARKKAHARRKKITNNVLKKLEFIDHIEERRDELEIIRNAQSAYNDTVFSGEVKEDVNTKEVSTYVRGVFEDVKANIDDTNTSDDEDDDDCITIYTPCLQPKENTMQAKDIYRRLEELKTL